MGNASASEAAGSLSARWFWLAFLGLYILTALPMLRAEIPPLVDYPNHLARMHVLIELPRSEALQQYYELRWRPLPNLAMDLTVPLLARIMPLEWAGKVFVLMFLALLPAGTALIHRVAAGQWSAWPLFAFVFLHNNLLVWGFLNYLFGLGLALMAFALWLALAGHGRAYRVGAAGVSALILFFAHLMACAIFALLISGHEIGRLWRERGSSMRSIVAGAVDVVLPFVFPVAILLGTGLGGETGDFAYEGVLHKLGFALLEGQPVLDIAAVSLWLLAAVGYVMRVVTIIPALRFPLLVLALAFVIAPARLMTAHGIDDRLPLAFALVLVGGTVSHRATARVVGVTALVGLAVFLVRTGVWEADFARAKTLYPRLIAILDQVPRGGRLAVAFESNDIGPTRVPINHLPTLAVLRRDAFVPTLFAYETQQPIIVTPAARALREAVEPRALWQAVMAGEAGEERARRALAGFDALVALGPKPFTVPPSRLLEPIGVEPNFALYRVVHGAARPDDSGARRWRLRANTTAASGSHQS